MLLGAVGGPQWDTLPRAMRPEQGILGIRKALGLFANLRPALLYPELAAASTLKAEVVAGLDLMIIRELTGDIYFGEPRGRRKNDAGEDEGFDTMRYGASEIRRIARVGFETARSRGKQLCSVDKANVLDTSILWREVVTETAKDYPDVALTHMYVDNAAMQLVRNPKQFDVIVTGNLFGDILSDEASMLAGSIGMLPSASLDARRKGLYEPIHGSAPDIAGQDKANPLATILSLAMMFRYTFERADVAEPDRARGALGAGEGPAHRRHRDARRADRRHARDGRSGRRGTGGLNELLVTGTDHAYRFCRLAWNGGLRPDAADARGARFRSHRAHVLHDVERRRQRSRDRPRHAAAQERDRPEGARGAGGDRHLPGRRLHERRAAESSRVRAGTATGSMPLRRCG